MSSHAPIYVAAGDTARNSGRSGIQTSVRRLVAEFGRRNAERTRLAFWNHRRNFLHSLPPQFSFGLAAEPLRRSEILSVTEKFAAFPGWFPGRAEFQIPLHWHPRYARELDSAWLLLPELLYGDCRTERFVAYARHHGMKVAAIFYDDIPVKHPEFSRPGLADLHRAYMRELSSVDLVLPISEISASAWLELMEREKLVSPRIQVVPLAAEISGVPQSLRPAVSRTEIIRGLCVSTVEPRKNHRALCAALEQIAGAAGSLPFEMDLVGAADRAAPELEAFVNSQVARFEGRVRWHRYADSSTLRQFYAQCDFTVYPSLVEGFGMPVLESLWFARPCICADFGVMRENARAGGCLTVDVRDPSALADAIQRLATDPNLRNRLALEATLRPIKTWSEYTDEIVQALDQF